MKYLLPFFVYLLCSASHAEHKELKKLKKFSQKHDLLTLQDVKENAFIPIPEGTIYTYKSSLFTGKTYKSEFRFFKEEDGAYYFRKVHDGELDTEGQFLLKSGREYYSYKGSDYAPLNSFDNCDKYFIGTCVTKSSKERVRMYKDGIWRYTYQGAGQKVVDIYTIYDKSGMLLYELEINTSTENPNKSKHKYKKLIKR